MINWFFHIIEFAIYGFSIYLLIYKDDKILFYLPVVFYAYFMIDPIAPASLNYLLNLLLIGKVIHYHPSFFKNNPFALILGILYIFLLHKTTDFVFIRPYMFSVISLFIFIPLTVEVYKKYSRPELFKELYRSAIIVLILFVLNALASTISGFAPTEMYGIKSGILFGNQDTTFFNILAFAFFVTVYRLTSQNRPLDLLLFIVALSFIMLSLRRSAMGLSAMSIVTMLIILVLRGKVEKVVGFILLSIFAGAFIYFSTDFIEEFIHRVELRKLDERELAEEKRFFEYEMLYKDTFVTYDYDPWLGYGLFDSRGNYGKGAFGERSLHGDLTNIFHSTGIIGVFLYLAMIATAFVQALMRVKSSTDFLIVCFCGLVFGVYTITGRYTQVDNMFMMTLVLMLPMGKVRRKSQKKEITHETTLPN
ncbi:O-antigen ligase family protein [Echinicola shivajiensis]|uniref:O-antigen ligase family protein n=1 Tax=Echinicola shivajiensis TaxID=1035916 RepID=UPI001BFC954C|nr:O-antigen ligase family protein [Echinicola shivajiensis]